MKDKIRILFFTPYASRTGSEVMLWYILKHFDRNRFEAAIVSFTDGELIRQVPKDVPVFIVPSTFNVYQKVAFHLGWHPTKEGLKKVAKQFKADVWYINTIMLPFVITEARKLNIPVITHVHELGHMFAHIVTNDFKTIINQSDLLIGCSGTVCETLSQSGAAQVRQLYSFVDLDVIKPDVKKIQRIRKELNAKPGDFIWIMSGTTSERKGFDLLPDIALKLPAEASIHIVWIGRLINDGLVYWTVKRCEQISHIKIHLVGAHDEDYYSYLAAADGFMMTSRQEPFGLVMVEAAWLGKPIVSFESGGPQEFLIPEIGTLVPGLNIPEFAEKLEYWRNNINLFDAEKAKSRSLQFGAQKGMENWTEIIESFFETKRETVPQS